MLPGYVSGFYTYDECHIDLVRLAQFANARLIHAEATSIDINSQEVLLTGGRPALPYDVLSLNIGIAPSTSEIPGAAKYSTPVKPISQFAARFQTMVEEAVQQQPHKQIPPKTLSSTGKDGQGRKEEKNDDDIYRVAVVGGGPSGVELACAVHYRLTAERRTAGIVAPVEVALVSRGEILAQLAPYARKTFIQLLQERSIQLFETQGGVKSVTQTFLTLEDGTEVPFNTCLWCTQASTASWLAATGLPTDDRGFLLVNEFLQAEGGPDNVFGAGDCTASTRNPRPKAGVYAVRAGRPLAENISSYIQEKPLRPWSPQSTHLNLISAGDRYAIAVKGSWLGWRGAVLWRWKDWIDRKFMAQFGTDLDFDAMSATTRTTSTTSRQGLGPEAAALAAAAKMRCGGCGAKVGATTLQRVLQKLSRDAESSLENPNNNNNKTSRSSSILFSSPDDAAVLVPPPPGHLSIHTVDFFRSFIADQYTFGAIASNHALSDCYAMGGEPSAAMAIAVLPFSSEKKVESDLYQLMAGACHVLAEAGCELVGGHSCEGAELSLGFSVVGSVCKENILPKAGLKAGQVLILTKPLGTGVIMAASMRGSAQGRWVAGAIDSMLLSNATASKIFLNFNATACTDVTGFGLLGHLAEMASASGVRVEVDGAAVPLLPGSIECSAAGVLSSLHIENAKVAAVVENAEDVVGSALWPLLVDPQTSGGLLGAVAVESAEACVAELRRQGCCAAAVVGRVVIDSGGGGVSAAAADSSRCIRVNI